MITWVIVFILFILLLLAGETAVNIYLTNLLQPAHDKEDAIVKEN
jgi:hypothetical protein